jgi:hypothetical protein
VVTVVTVVAVVVVVVVPVVVVVVEVVVAEAKSAQHRIPKIALLSYRHLVAAVFWVTVPSPFTTLCPKKPVGSVQTVFVQISCISRAHPVVFTTSSWTSFTEQSRPPTVAHTPSASAKLLFSVEKHPCSSPKPCSMKFDSPHTSRFDALMKGQPSSEQFLAEIVTTFLRCLKFASSWAFAPTVCGTGAIVATTEPPVPTLFKSTAAPFATG